MLEPFLKWLFGAGIQLQVDLGNLSVGLATMLVALVSLSVAGKASKSNNKQKVAEFRRDWIERLRLQFSEFIGAVHLVRNASLSVHEKKTPESDLDVMHGRINLLETQLKLYLNPLETNHAALIKEIEFIRGNAAQFSLSPSSEVVSKMDDSIGRATGLAKMILKAEWDRTTRDMLGTHK